MFKSIGIKLKENVQIATDLFRKYPVTLGSVLILALLNAVFIEGSFPGTVMRLYNDINLCLAYFAAQSLFVEELFGKDNNRDSFSPVKYLSLEVFALSISIFAAYSNNHGINLLYAYSTVIFPAYAVALSLFTVYHMYKRQAEGFETYCIKVFISGVKSSFIFGIISVGVLIIFLIIETLLFDSAMEVMGRIEVFLAIGFYIPLILSCLAMTKERLSTFARVVVIYVLQPLLLIAFVVVYVYIFKIIFTLTLPSNEVFEILAFLFAAGFPIWTMAQSFNGTEYENKLSVLAKYIPYAYIPFIILECICVGIRINAYGITPERYLGLALIVFEILYFFLYIFGQRKKKNIVSLSLPLAAVFIIIIYVIPYVNATDTTIRSQMARLNESLRITEPTDGQKGDTYNIFSSIRDMGTRGQYALEKAYDENTRENIAQYKKFRAKGSEELIEKNISVRAEYAGVDIGSYKKMSEIQMDFGKDMDQFIVKSADGICTADLSPVVKEVLQFANNTDNRFVDYSAKEIFVLDKNTGFMCTGGYIEITNATGEIENGFLEGYLLY